MKSWLDQHPRAENLVFSCPWLFFMWFPISDAIKAERGWPAPLALACCAAFVILYVTMWLRFPTQPWPEYRPPLRYYAGLVGLVALQLTFVAFGSAENMQMLIFVAAVIGFQTAWRHFVLLTFCLVALTLIESSYLLHTDRASNLAVAITTAMITMFSFMFCGFSALVATNKRLELANHSIRQLTQVQERERISADLHDILGQSLTAITLTTQLAGKLIDAGQFERAREQIEGAHELAQQALTDVRAVVRDARRLTVGDEVQEGIELLLTAEVTSHVSGTPVSLPEASERIAAHVVREAVVNVVHHSSALRCWITTSADSVTIEDDGAPMKHESAPRKPGGSGLTALAERVEAAGGTLTYGRAGRGWRVRARFKIDA